MASPSTVMPMDLCVSITTRAPVSDNIEVGSSAALRPRAILAMINSAIAQCSSIATWV
jgi:hypothetical protein